VYDQLVPDQEALIVSLFQELSADEQRDLLELLRRLDQSLDEAEPRE
jgi:hypothetical protein